MAEITVAAEPAAKDEPDATAEAVQVALGTGYVILRDDASGTATIVADDLADDELAAAIDASPLTEAGS